MDENAEFLKVKHGRNIAAVAIALCLLLATPPFLGFCYSFFIGDVDLAIFKFVPNYEIRNPIVRAPLAALVTVSMFPSYVIATLFPIRGVTIFMGEGIVAPKPIVTVVFWLTMALCAWRWMPRKTRLESLK